MSGFRSVRWMRTINLVAQAILVVTLCAGLNYIAFNHSLRWDLTSRSKFSLSPETRAYLQGLDRPVTIVVTLLDNSNVPQVAAALPDIRGLLREFVYATENNVEPAPRDGRISVEYIDVYARNREAAQLDVKEPNVIKFICGERSRVVHLDELYHTDKGELSSFLGEQVFTTAILDVVKSQKKVYFLTGHGEARLDDTSAKGLSSLAAVLKQRNFAVETIDVEGARGVPPDASLLVAVNPLKVSPPVQEKLRQYLTQTTQNGRLLLFLDPGRDIADVGLKQLVEDWGIWVDDDVVLDDNPSAVTAEGQLLVTQLAMNHPVTQELAEAQNQPPRVGFSRSMREDFGGQKLSGLVITPLAATSDKGWGKRNYSTDPNPTFTPGVDIRGLPQLQPSNRLALVFASERVRPRDDLRFSVANGRVVVFGSSDYATNQLFDNIGNQTLVLNAVSWASGRDSWLNIPARPVERFQLTLSSRDLTRLRYSLLLFLPGAAALLGIFVYWTRRT